LDTQRCRRRQRGEGERTGGKKEKKKERKKERKKGVWLQHVSKRRLQPA
jgi:hypothetical protein